MSSIRQDSSLEKFIATAALERWWQLRAGRSAGVRLIGLPTTDGLSSVLLFQRRAFVHRDVLGFVTLDLVLWIIRGRVMRVSLVIDVVLVNLYNMAADMSRL